MRGSSNEATTAGEKRKKGSEGAQEGGESQGGTGQDREETTGCGRRGNERAL